MCRDLGNRASLVNSAHMMRPSSLIFTVAGERALSTQKKKTKTKKTHVEMNVHLRYRIH